MSSWLLAACAAIIVGAVVIQATASDPSPPSPSAKPSESPQASATPDPLAGWSTFSDPRLGLTFRFPSEWGQPSVLVEAGTSGSQFRGSFSGERSVTFGGNSSDYAGPGRGASFYDFYRFAPKGSGSYEVTLAAGKSFEVQASEVPAVGAATGIVFTGRARSQVFDSKDAIGYVNTGATPFGGIAFRYMDASNGGVDVLKKLVGSLGGVR